MVSAPGPWSGADREAQDAAPAAPDVSPEAQPEYLPRRPAWSPPGNRKLTGRDAAKKREIADRLDAYCARTGLGASARIAAASRGKLAPEIVAEMRERARFPLETWRSLEKALDRLEKGGGPDG